MIEINETFTVAAPPAEVYAVLSDPNAVVECVAGAELGEQHEDGSYDGKMTVKFSALRVAFAGKVALELDDEARQGTVHARGRDGQGGTKFEATATFKVEPTDGGAASIVGANGEVVLSGKLASVIEGAAGAVVKRMTADFVDALSLRCASGTATLGPSTPTAAPIATTPSSAPEQPPMHAVPEPAPTSTAAVLLLHGYAASPNGVRPLGQALADAGLAVSIPRLPGHGTRWKDLAQTTWQDWYAEAEKAFLELRAQHDQVFVMGLSVGATLGLRLAEQRPTEVAGLLAINPAVSAPLGTPKPLGLTHFFRRSSVAVRNDIKRSGGSDVGYERIPLRATRSLISLGKLVLGDLGRLTCPVLLVTSSVDHVVPTADAEALWAGMSAQPADRERQVFENSYHVVTLDNDAPALNAAGIEFVQSHALVSRS